MRIKNKIFPYPILNSNIILSNYINGRFDFNFDEVDDENYYIMKNIQYDLSSDLLKKLIDDGLVSVYCVIECSYTVYRKAFLLSKEKSEIKLDKNDFNENVDISLFIVANEDFILKGTEFDEEYNNISFEIDKNDILAANDGYTINFIHEENENNLVRSIFSIIQNEDFEKGIMDVNHSQGRKITITLSIEDYKNYKKIYIDDDYKEVFFNMILIPALVEGLSDCKLVAIKDEDCDIEDIGNEYMWFRSVVSAYKKINGMDLTVDYLKENSSIKLAQEIMGKPIGKAFDKLLICKRRGVDDE